MSMTDELIKELAEEVMVEEWQKNLEQEKSKNEELEKYRRWYYTGEPPKTQYPKPLVAEEEDSDDDEPIQFKK